MSERFARLARRSGWQRLRGGQAEAEGSDAPSPQNDIVPAASVAGRALAFVIAIMTFLASLTLGGVTLVNATAENWQNDIAREITIQIAPPPDGTTGDAVLKAIGIASAHPGILSATPVGDADMRELLAPWLGSGLDLDELPVPDLIALEVDPASPPDLIALRAALADAVPTAALDDHRAWVERLSAMASATTIAGVLIFALVMVATVLTVVFATRGAMAGNSEVIEVLHFVGAERSYIAGQFQQHFLLLGLKGALFGGLAAVVLFLIADLWLSTGADVAAQEQTEALIGTFDIGAMGYLGTALLVIAIAVLTALTSRATVLRHVGSLDASGTRSGS